VQALSEKSILVTGGAGFIGSNLCEALVDLDCQVVCLDNFETGNRENIANLLARPNFKLIEGDIRDYDTCLNAAKGIDIILHQAALGSVPRSIDDPLRTHSTNNTGFLNMLEAARQAKVDRFVYAASSSTYGDLKDLPKVEEKIGKPLSPYAVTKYVNELYAGVFANLYGLKVIGLRYFNVFGRRQDPEGAYAAAIPKFIKAMLKGESPIIHGDGTQSRDFTYIDNVIQINLLAASTENSEAFNQVYNVAFGERKDLNTLFQLIKKELITYYPEVEKVEAVYGEERKGDVKHSLADISKARRLLNYDPTFDLDEGMKRAIPWYIKIIK
jgi:UDP-N-acetylglucosamine 4-epimerase